MMATKFSWIALFVTLQISAVLCRTTGKPDEEDKTIHQGPILFSHGHAAVAKPIAEYFSDNLGESTNKSASPSMMSWQDDSDDDTFISDTYVDTILTSYAIAGIIIAVFSTLSLILGCIVMACYKKEPRRGYIVNSNTGGQPGIPVAGAPGAVIHPPTYGQTQQQNTYPTKY